MWNPHCWQQKNAHLLEELIEGFEFIINNDSDFPICPQSQGISIIHLTLTN